jgi:hypothetical protein
MIGRERIAHGHTENEIFKRRYRQTRGGKRRDEVQAPPKRAKSCTDEKTEEEENRNRLFHDEY